MKVAVLMSTYNGEKFVKEQIDSILEQQGDFSLDLYVRDDGSTDNTIGILKDYMKRNKLYWYTGANLKPAKSFINLLWNCGEYDYYAFSDQDDYWEKNKIQIGLKMLSGHKDPALYCSNAELVDGQLNSLGRRVYKLKPRTDFNTLICAGGLLGCTMIYNSALAQKIIKKEDYPNMVLHDFYMAAVCVSLGGQIVYNENPSIKYRQHDSNAIGVSHGLLGTIIGRLKDITYKEPVSIADQAKAILNLYGCEIDEQKKDWLLKVANYKNSFINRLKLSCSKKTRYINKNIGVKLRLSILLGNR